MEDVVKIIFAILIFLSVEFMHNNYIILFSQLSKVFVYKFLCIFNIYILWSLTIATLGYIFRMDFLLLIKIAGSCNFLLTNITMEWFFSRVNSNVSF